MHHVEARKITYKIANALIVVLMLFLIVITIYPMYYTICASFSDARALMKSSDLLLKPLEPATLEGYRMVFSNPNILHSFYNTIFYVVVGTAISMALTIAGAYVTSREDFLPRNVMMKGMLFTMFFSGGLIPWFFVVRDLGMYNTRWAIVIPAALSTYNLIIMRTFFKSIPAALEESALLDGAQRLSGAYPHHASPVLLRSGGDRNVLRRGPVERLVSFSDLSPQPGIVPAADDPARTADPQRNVFHRQRGQSGRGKLCERPDQVLHHYSHHRSDPGHLSFPAKVFCEGRHDRRCEGLSQNTGQK